MLDCINRLWAVHVFPPLQIWKAIYREGECKNLSRRCLPYFDISVRLYQGRRIVKIVLISHFGLQTNKVDITQSYVFHMSILLE